MSNVPDQILWFCIVYSICLAIGPIWYAIACIQLDRESEEFMREIRRIHGEEE